MLKDHPRCAGFGSAPAALPYGQVAIGKISLEFTGYLGTPDTYAGWFVCDDEELNRYWYAALARRD